MPTIQSLSTRKLFWLLLLVAVATIIPFLGVSDFHTKGEPREAVVALSMLEQGNWILPMNNGGDIPYKPPFFHWCIAAASMLNGGVVSEFTARIPSAIALIAMTMTVFLFYAHRKGNAAGLLTAVVLLTSFEIHRAGPNCRVDMMLTALTVGALISYYHYYERGLRGVPWLAILLMSMATLTKGPVGSVIPSLCFGLFLLLRRINFLKAFGLLLTWGVMSLILPACWYLAAYHQGGEEFLRLAMEENFGRMTDSMSYEVHVNPWYYNEITLLSGLLPWTLLLIFSVFSLRKLRAGERFKDEMLKFYHRFSGDSVNLLSVVCVVVILVFYTIPSCKRSVYLMPLYPFLSYFIAVYIIKLKGIGSTSLKVYGWMLAAIAILLPAIFMAIKLGAIPESVCGHGRHAAQNAAMLRELAGIGGIGFLLAILPAVVALGWLRDAIRKGGERKLLWICAMTFAIYVSLDGAYQPRIFAAKSQRAVVSEIESIAPASRGTLYEYISEAEHSAGDPIHFFELNFYLGDRTRNFLKEKPSEGFLMLTDEDAEIAIPRFEQDGYQFFPVYESEKEVLHHRPIRLYRFVKISSDCIDS